MRHFVTQLRSIGKAAGILILSIFVLGFVMWAFGPVEGNKYSDLGINLFVGAVLGLAILHVESSIGRAEAERERRIAEEQRFLQTLIASDDLTDMRVPGRNLAGSILSSRDLTGAELAGAELSRTDFRKSRLTKVDVSNSRADGLNLTGAVVDMLNARSVSWTNATLVRLSGSEVDFTGSSIKFSTLADSRLPRACLDNCDWGGLDLRRTDFSECHGVTVDLHGVDLRGASLRGGSLFAANLRDADLRSADLRDAQIHDSDLRGADLRDCRIDGLSLKSPVVDEATRLPNSVVIL